MGEALVEVRGDTPRIFLSYASEDFPWVSNFRHDAWFGSFLGGALIADYKIPSVALPYGDLNTWIDETVEGASAVLLFLSEAYTRKAATVQEFHATLAQAHHRNIEIVPVMLDVVAINWWNEWKAEGALSALGDNYQYANFIENGSRKQVTTPSGLYIDATTTQIRALAELIRGRIARPVAVVPEGSVRPLVILGHPTDRFAEAVARHIEALKAELGPSRHSAWNDGWRTDASAREEAGTVAVTYIQPLGRDADDYVDDLGRVRRSIERLVPPAPPISDVVLWAPLSGAESDFSKVALANPIDPALRTGSAEELANWLRTRTGEEPKPNTPVVQVEDWSEMEGEHVGVRRLVHQILSDTVATIVEPQPETWPFRGDLFRRQLLRLVSREQGRKDNIRLIVAVHDMNIQSYEDDKKIRSAIEAKFSDFQERFEEICRPLSANVDVFWTALLVRHADVLPFARWPASSRLQEWNALLFWPTDDASHVELDADSRDMYLGSLHEWAHKLHGEA